MAGMTFRGMDDRTCSRAGASPRSRSGSWPGRRSRPVDGIVGVVDTNPARLPWLFERLFAFLAYGR